MLCANMTVPPEVRAALLARHIDTHDTLTGLTIPVLVSHGTHDTVVLPSMANTSCPPAPAPSRPGTATSATPRFSKPAPLQQRTPRTGPPGQHLTSRQPTGQDVNPARHHSAAATSDREAHCVHHYHHPWPSGFGIAVLCVRGPGRQVVSSTSIASGPASSMPAIRRLRAVMTASASSRATCWPMHWWMPMPKPTCPEGSRVRSKASGDRVENIPVVVVVLNNANLGYQRHAENYLFGRTTTAIDFAPVDHAAMRSTGAVDVGRRDGSFSGSPMMLRTASGWRVEGVAHMEDAPRAPMWVGLNWLLRWSVFGHSVDGHIGWSWGPNAGQGQTAADGSP